MAPDPKSPLPLDTGHLRPGLRLAVGLSGGADSVALLRALCERRDSLGLVLHAAHLHHGLRGAEADADLDFSRNLAAQLAVPFHEFRVDAQAEARRNSQTIEEAARHLRYSWFRTLLSGLPLDAVATAHTLDDQAETVLAKFLRGAWTEGLSAIHPVVAFPEGRVLRPLLHTTRTQIEAYLNSLSQSWREDSSNRHLTFTRNRIRHQLLPLLETWNPQLRVHLSNMATLALDEESWWQAELKRIAPQLILSGRPVRGGGRASGEALAIDVTRLAALAPALQRRLLRFAAQKLGAEPDFAATELLLSLALLGHAGQSRELAQGLLAERTPRELRLTLSPLPSSGTPAGQGTGALPQFEFPLPGELLAEPFGIRLHVDLDPSTPTELRSALLRNWRPGDRVRLRHSSSPKKVKEVLERMRVTGTDRRLWPVLEIAGRILWMRGVELEPEPGIAISSQALPQPAAPPAPKPPST